MNEQIGLDLEVDYGWFHIMRPRIKAGLIKEVGETAWAVYTVIKAHADQHTGKAWPSQETIGEMIGKSPLTVSRATNALIEKGLIKTGRHGNGKVYTLVESASMRERQTGIDTGSVDFPYIPRMFKEQLDEIKSFLSSGIPPGKGVTLNFYFNNHSGAGSINNIQRTSDSAQGSMQELFQKLRGV